MTRQSVGDAHPTIEELVSQIHRAARPMVLVVTGGGSGAIAALLEVPGASRSVLEAAVPYAPQALAAWLGAAPEQACAPRTARAMAMAAFQRSRRYMADFQAAVVGSPQIAGLSCTASLATDRPKHGDHRLFIALQTAVSTLEWSLVLAKGSRSREQEEDICTRVLLNAAAEACGIEGWLALELSTDEHLELRRCDAPLLWQQLLAGEIDATDAAGQQMLIAGGAHSVSTVGRLIFPGAFNPLHEGHQRMAEFAAARLGLPLEFELSITNVDKPPLDFLEMAARARQFVGQRLWFTSAETFVKKSRLFPGATFVVGADTLERIGQPRYYDGDPGRRDAALAEIRQQGCGFLVFGRVAGGGFSSLATLRLPEALAMLCHEIPQSEFRHDISSTALRAADHSAAD